MTDNNIIEDLQGYDAKPSIIMVAGVGGAGGNAVNHMWEMGITGVNFVVLNTDSKALDNSPVPTKICLGADGLGAGNIPEAGRQAAIESLDAVRNVIETSGTKMIFIAAGMGGGTGTGASPVIAKLAHEMGLLTVAIVTSPLKNEGTEREENARKGIEELRQYVDSLLVLDNDRIADTFSDLPFINAFGKADDVMAMAAKGISEIITVKNAYVRVDFKDVNTVMRGSGRAHMGVASAEGEDRARIAVEQALNSPLLDSNLISGAKAILINISVSDIKTLIYREVMSVLNCVQEYAKTVDENGREQRANIIWGASEKPSLGEAMELVVVATGFPNKNVDASQAAKKPEKPQPNPLQGAANKDSVFVPVKTPAAVVPVPPVVPQQVVLGKRSTRYDNIGAMLAHPAYQTRNVRFVVETDSVRHKEVMKDSRDKDVPTEKTGSLFD